MQIFLYYNIYANKEDTSFLKTVINLIVVQFFRYKNCTYKGKTRYGLAVKALKAYDTQSTYTNLIVNELYVEKYIARNGNKLH